MKADFHAMVATLTQCRSILSKEEYERRAATAARSERLARAKPPMSREDIAMVVSDTLKDAAPLRAVKRWLSAARGLDTPTDRPMKFLALLGPGGRGKTIAAAWAIAELGGIYISAPEFRRLASSSLWSDRPRLDELYGCRLLVIDDMGSETISDPSTEAIFDIVNARQVEGAVTILTGNLTRQQFTDRYTERVTQRIEHQGFFCESAGPDLRRK
jgi:DNA replication protein DnaC